MRKKVWLLGIALMAVTLPLCLAQKKSPVNGRWEAKLGSQTYRFDFTEDQGDVTGSIRLPDDQAVEVEYGLIFGKELEFTTVEDGVEYEWTAEVSRNSIKGERLNLDDETVIRFTARRTR